MRRCFAGLRVPILHADDWLVALDKPAGVLSAPGRGSVPTVQDLLRRQKFLGSAAELLLIHRLDKGASGVMVLARSVETQRLLSAQWKERRIEKVYLALVCGHVFDDGEVNLPLLVDRDHGRVVPSGDEGKPAQTFYRVIERLPGHTLLEARPVTGRLHQIRVHLAAIGHPLAIDPLYGGGRAILLSAYKQAYRPNRRREERPLIDRLTLHAASVRLNHPIHGQAMTFEAPLPKDFKATVRQLRRLLNPACGTSATPPLPREEGRGSDA